MELNYDGLLRLRGMSYEGQKSSILLMVHRVIRELQIETGLHVGRSYTNLVVNRTMDLLDRWD